MKKKVIIILVIVISFLLVGGVTLFITDYFYNWNPIIEVVNDFKFNQQKEQFIDQYNNKTKEYNNIITCLKKTEWDITGLYYLSNNEDMECYNIEKEPVEKIQLDSIVIEAISNAWRDLNSDTQFSIHSITLSNADGSLYVKFHTKFTLSENDIFEASLVYCGDEDWNPVFLRGEEKINNNWYFEPNE